MNYLEACLKEAMRLYPPVVNIPRQTSEDTTLGGYFIPKGVMISVQVYAMHRDPKNYEEPEKDNF